MYNWNMVYLTFRNGEGNMKTTMIRTLALVLALMLSLPAPVGG